MVDLKQRMSDGGVSAQEVADAFESATSEGGLFYGSMEEQSKTFNGQMSTLKDNVSTFLGNAFKPLFDFAKNTALPVLNDLATGGKETKKWLNENKNSIIIVAGVLGTFVTAIIAYNIAMNIATITTTIATVATTAFGAVLAFITSPITLVVLAIGALITIGVLLYKNWDTVKEFAMKVWTAIVDFFIGIGKSIGDIIVGIIDFFKKIPEYIGFMVGFIIGLFVSFYEFMWNFWTVTIPEIIMGIIDWFKELPKNILNFFGNIISGIATWVVNMVRTVKEKFPEIINNIVNFFAQLPGKMIDIGKNIITGIWEGIKSMTNWIGDKISDFAGGITKGFKKALGIASPSKVFKKEAKWIPVGVGIGIEENTDEAIKGIDKLSDSMVNRMQQAVSLEAGKVSFSGTNGSVSQILTANGTTTVVNDNKLYLDGDVVYENQKTVEAKKNLQTQFS